MQYLYEELHVDGLFHNSLQHLILCHVRTQGIQGGILYLHQENPPPHLLPLL